MRSTNKTVMRKVDASISKTREHLKKNASFSSITDTEVKVYNFDDSQVSNQFVIVI